MTTPSKRLPRFERRPKEAPRIQLTDRDRELCYTLYHYRRLPTSLLIERHFGSATRGRNRLKLLYHHGYLDRTFPPTPGPATAEAIYSLGPAAVPELAVFYGLPTEEIRRRRRVGDPLFAAHELLVATTRLRLAYAGAPVGVGLKDWKEGPDARLETEARDPQGNLTVRPVTPDGMGWVQSQAARFAFCLEADRGTMTVGRVREKFARYRVAGPEAKRVLGASRFRVLVVAPSARRIDSLRAAAEAAQCPNVWLTTEAALAGNPVTDAVWERAGVSGVFPLFKPAQLLPQKSPRRS